MGSRRNFLTSIPPLVAVSAGVNTSIFASAKPESKPSSHLAKTKKVLSRIDWVNYLDRIATPVLSAMATTGLRTEMPVEFKENTTTAKPHPTSDLEAFARTFAGVSPFLTLSQSAKPQDPAEAALGKQYNQWVVDAFEIGLSTTHAAAFRFDAGKQVLVEMAFLAQGFLRAPHILPLLSQQAITVLTNALLLVRKIEPYNNNWHLFASMVECCLKSLDQKPDLNRVEVALAKHDKWYLGDGIYADGPAYHQDYYNSFVIHPMLHQTLQCFPQYKSTYPNTTKRFRRYAQQQLLQISAEGYYPPTGRSITYRMGAFHALAMAVQDASVGLIDPALASDASPNKDAQALRGLSLMLSKFTPEKILNRNRNGAEWLSIGLYGHQKNLGEDYISTGSLYLCCQVFLPLGLPSDAPVWQNYQQVLTPSEALINGEDQPADAALKDI